MDVKLRWQFWEWKCWAHRWKVEKSKLLITFLNELLTVWKNINFQKSYNTFSVARARKKWSWTIWRPSSVRVWLRTTRTVFSSSSDRNIVLTFLKVNVFPNGQKLVQKGGQELTFFSFSSMCSTFSLPKSSPALHIPQ